jgi:hypothetical protein
MVIHELDSTKPGGCEKSGCAGDATYQVTWDRGTIRKFLCTTHRKQLVEDPRVLAEWFPPK